MDTAVEIDSLCPFQLHPSGEEETVLGFWMWMDSGIQEQFKQN